MHNPLESKPFQAKVGLSNYARWAKDLTEEQLVALFGAVGDYGCRAKRCSISFENGRLEGLFLCAGHRGAGEVVTSRVDLGD